MERRPHGTPASSPACAAPSLPQADSCRTWAGRPTHYARLRRWPVRTPALQDWRALTYGESPHGAPASWSAGVLAGLSRTSGTARTTSPGAYPPAAMQDDLRDLFAAHLATQQEGLADDLEKTQFSAVVVAAGTPSFYYRDDQPAPFRANPSFLWFCPFEAPGHLLLLRPERRPLLIAYQPEDFWYEVEAIGTPFWVDGFRVVECPSRKKQIAELAAALGKERTAWLGARTGPAEALGLVANPPSLQNRLDWRRAVKTPYEVGCVSAANRIAARGHRACQAAFDSGATELEIHHVFVKAVGGTEADLPYPTIVGLDEKGAVLHYEGKRAGTGAGASLLIDAGARVRGYSSDITRTHAGAAATDAFRALIAGMETAQHGIASSVVPGRPWAEVHMEAHRALSEVLADNGIINCSAEAAVRNGLSSAFFPHGLGHFLGLQVHDVGGHLAGPEGLSAPPPESHPSLRTTRTLAPGQIITVEPGIYFIEMLLRPWRDGDADERRAVNWDAVDALKDFGGVRIEDDVLVTERAPRNLTREYLPE